MIRKLILAGAALAAIVVDHGSAWGGVEPHAVPPPIWYNNSGGPVINNYGWPYAQAGRQYFVDPRTGQTYRIARGNDRDGDGIRDSRDSDRDGDGVKNYRDRWPDDPRYR
jgi:hypothetical protein